MDPRKLAAFLAALVMLFGASRGLAQQDTAQSLKTLTLNSASTIRYAAPWTPSGMSYSNAWELVALAGPGPTAEGRPQQPAQVPVARALITIERRTSHEDALRRLEAIAASRTNPVEVIEVGGWPAVELKFDENLPRRGAKEEKDDEGAAPDISVRRLITAIAANTEVLKFDVTILPAAPQDMLQRAEGLTRSAQFAVQGDPVQVQGSLQRLRATESRRRSSRQGAIAPEQHVATATAAPPGYRPASQQPGAAVTVETGLGELEIAASANATNVVIASNGGLSFSSNGAASFSSGMTGVFGLNDPSLARAASSNFYLGVIAFPNGTPAQLNVTGCTNAVSSSTNNGTSFQLQGYSAQCPLTGSGVCFPDQEKIAADAVNTAPAGGDQLYATWRNFTPAGAVTSCRNIGTGFSTSSISCSQNSGTAWTPVAAITGAGDFPRVAVGPAGDVYVVSLSGNSIQLDRFTSCANGLTEAAGFPVTVATLRDAISCPIAGLDRCNNGNTMSSPTVAPDPDPANPNHVFVSFAEGNGQRGGRIVVMESTDRGLTFPNRWVVTDPPPARRFMPWSCTTSGAAWVGWYDRRAATASGATNDLTDYFLGSPSTANTNLSNNPDPQCASGWPCAPRSSGDSDLCTVQPQLAGICRTASGGGSGNRCDFDAGGCPAGETCQPGGGCPKYGDYNGLACAGKAAFAAWSSATAPLGVTAPSSGINVYGAAITIPAITVPNVVGLARSDAERVLAAAGLCFNATFPLSAAGDGSASGQSPSAGTSVASRSTVSVAYASPLGGGIPGSSVTCPIAVPDIIGRGRVDAEPTLAAAGVCFKASFPFSANGDGSATTESPPGGSLVVPSTVVAVAYPNPLGDGIPDSPVTCPIAVPDVIALDRSDAERTLAAAGLCFQANFPFNADGNGLATAQNPAAGSFVLSPTTVEVDYASPLGGGPPGPATCP